MLCKLLNQYNMKKILLLLVLGFIFGKAYSQAEILNVGRDDSNNWSGWGSKIYISGVGDYTDGVYLAKYCVGKDLTQMRLSVGDGYYGEDCVVIGRDSGIDENDPNNWTGFFYFYSGGKCGIKTSNPQSELDVNGTIRANEILVSSGWADFVFKEDYKLPTIEEVERHIKNNGTLPGVPTEKEIKATGVNLAETDVLLLQKIEELTLYIIDLKQEIDKLKMQIKE